MLELFDIADAPRCIRSPTADVDDELLIVEEASTNLTAE